MNHGNSFVLWILNGTETVSAGKDEEVWII